MTEAQSKIQAPSPYLSWMQLALTEAARWRGSTSPNPPVGAVLLTECGRMISIGAHERAGLPHAEVCAIEKARAQGQLQKAHTLVVTLEPCTHFGRTPPCVDAILNTPHLKIRRVVIGCLDPNPEVHSKGVQRLRDAGIEVIEGVLQTECEDLISAFRQKQVSGQPWLTIKTAMQSNGSMIPEPGEKTFTTSRQLDLAHSLRKRSDAILTGSGTVLQDQPEFTVRRVPDFEGKKRRLYVLDRRGRVSSDYLQEAEARGLEAHRENSVENVLNKLSQTDALEVLVEAGPTLSCDLLEQGLWNEHWILWEDGRTERRLNPNPSHVQRLKKG